MTRTSTTSISVASVEAIRARFPALTRRYEELPVAYFDGPGGTQVPDLVVDRMTDYLLHHNANTHWHFPTSLETDAALDGARRALADFLNASPKENAFGNNMTTITFHVARALGREWGSGDEIVVTELDHHANIAPWRALARERGVTVRTVKMRAEGQVDWEDFERAVGPRTRLVAMGAASNALGTVSDVARAAALVHAQGGLMFVDAVHYAPHALVDVRALGCDLLACSSYKFYGPHAGVLYGAESLLARLDVPKLDPAPDTAPERLETGTQNHEGIVGAGAAVDFLASLAEGDGLTRRAALEASFTELHARGQALVTALYDGLRAISGVTVYGPPPDRPRTPTVSFVVRDRSSDEVARELVSRGLFLSNGDFYATTVVDRLGHAADGLVRAGCACYTTGEEVERLVQAVGVIAG